MADKQSMPVTLKFKRGLRTDGELIAVTLVQNEAEIVLSQAQAVMLANQLNARFAPDK